ncbi:MAG: T9SS type A sorting domain-containing protein [Bacteroidia bacterium]|nr:T9SS type A sorting domain-containing protein [Bacteroidia bacterium]MDW8157810.1 T9SS type A sorting domain-containing protein [Bacteroidia bacterium]
MIKADIKKFYKMKGIHGISLYLLYFLGALVSIKAQDNIIDPKAKTTLYKKPLTLDLRPFVTGPEQDCESALSLCSLAYRNPYSYTGWGRRQEVVNTCLLMGERNSVWFVFTVQQGGTFGFEIRPENLLPFIGGDDYDFALYDITNATCSDIPRLTPVRCNYSADGQITGLRFNSVSDIIPISYTATDPPMMPGLNVRAGQRFALIVDNYSGSTSGFRLTATGTAVVGNVTPPSFTGALDINCRDQLTKLVTVNFSHPVRCSSVQPEDFVILDPDGNTARITDVFCISGTDFASFIRVAFTTPTRKNGRYRLVHRGDVRDNCNNIMRNGEEIAFNVTHVPTISANFSPLECNSTTLFLTASAEIEATSLSYLWQGPNGFSSTEANPSITPPVGGTYSVVAIADGCTSATAAVNVTFAPAPTADFNVSQNSVCANQEIAIFYTGTASPQADFRWNCNGCNPSLLSGSGPFSVSWGLPGIKTISLVVIENGCTSAIANKTINVASAPGATFQIRQAGCVNEQVELSIIESNNAITFQWNCMGCSPQPQGRGPHLVSWNTPGKKTITLTTEGDERCPFGVSTEEIHIVAIPEPPLVRSQNLCAGQTIAIAPTFSGAEPDNVFVYTQSQGGAPIELLTSPFLFSTTITTTTTYYFESVNTLAGCKSTVRTPGIFTVFPIPEVPRIENVRLCNAGVVAFTLQSLPQNANEVWLFDAPSGGEVLDIATAQGSLLYNRFLSQSKRFYVQSYAHANGCVSPRIPIEATILTSPGPPNAFIPKRCGVGEITMELVMGTPAGEKFRIYDAPQGGRLIKEQPAFENIFKTTIAQTTTFYVESYQELQGCNTSSRTAVVAEILDKPNLPAFQEIKICENTAATIPFQVVGPGSYQVELFADTSSLPISSGRSPINLVTPTLASSRTFFAKTYNLENGCTSNWQEIQVKVSPKPILPTPTPLGRCNPGFVHFTVATGQALVSTIRLYSAIGTTTPLAEANVSPFAFRTPLLTTHTTYYIQAVYEGCVGEILALPITVVPVLQLDVQTTPALLGNDGKIVVSVSGGMPPYTFVIGSMVNTTGIFSNLAPGTYTLRVNDSGNCIATRSIVVDAHCPLPNIPAIKENEKGQLILHWAPSSNAIVYQVTLQEEGQAPGPTLLVNDTFLILRRLTPETKYRVEIKAVCRNGRISAPQFGEFTTPLCNAVNFVYMTDVTETTALVNWSEMEGADSYEFSWRKQGNLEWEPLENLRQKSRFLNRLQRNTTYEVQIRTLCNEGSVQADIVYNSFTTLKCNTISNIWHTHLNPTTTLIEWQQGGSATQYEIRYAISGTSNWRRVVTTQPRIQLSGLLPQTSYEVQILPLCGIDAAQETKYSFTTHTSNPDCSTPLGVQTAIIGPQALQVLWQNVPNATHYSLRYNAEGQPPIIVPATAPFLLGNLTPGRIYNISVRAYCTNSITSAWSFPVAVFLPSNARSIEAANKESLLIYPNPAQNTIHLSIKLPSEEAQKNPELWIKIIDVNGKSVLYSSLASENTENYTLDISRLTQGMYTIAVGTAQQILLTQKLLIQQK